MQPETLDEISRNNLLTWAGVLESYARDWDKSFEHKPSYYTQEFWYLFVSCIGNAWRGSPLTMTEACQAMKVGSQRTREERIKKAIYDGYLEKKRSPDNGREIMLLPTDKLQAVVVSHLERTLTVTRQTLDAINAKQTSPN